VGHIQEFSPLRACRYYVLKTGNALMSLKTEHIAAIVATGIITWLLAVAFPFSPEGTVVEEYPEALRTINVESLSALSSAIGSALPGDHIVVKKGAYESKEHILVRAEGTEANPIVIMSEVQGGAEIRGDYGFRVEDSQSLIISGFKFTHSQDNSASTDNIAFVCDNCVDVRITRNTFALTTSYQGQNDEESIIRFTADWLGITGASSGNRIDNNIFLQKHTRGAFMLLLGDEGRVVQDTLVDHNRFSDQLYRNGNGGECFRIGNSALGNAAGNMIMEYNTFENCNGDREAVTIKASNNIVRYNTFRNNEGSLTFRHGDANTADGNIFVDGNNGIRVYGHDHRIVNNYFADNPMTVSSLLAPIVVGKGTVTADLSIPNTEHSQPRNILIAHNTLVNNQGGILIGYGDDARETYLPQDIVVANNVVAGSAGVLVSVLAGDATFGKNLLYPSGTAVAGDMLDGDIVRADPQLTMGKDGIYRPARTSPVVDGAASATYGISTDMDGQPRTGKFDIGADEVT
jgi:poly(beta-D-mannuronate) lyase